MKIRVRRRPYTGLVAASDSSEECHRLELPSHKGAEVVQVLAGSSSASAHNSASMEVSEMKGGCGGKEEITCCGNI